MPRDWSEQDRLIIAEFRAGGGKVGGYFSDKPLLLLTTAGPKTGHPLRPSARLSRADLQE
jgi:hypothetical protein